MDAVEQFSGVLAEFARETGRELKLDSRHGCSFLYGDGVFNLSVLPQSGQVVLWMWLGRLASDVAAPRRALRLLEMNDGWGESHGGTFMLDPETEVVSLADRRSVETISSADALAAWMDALYAAVNYAWEEMEFAYPYVDDDPLEPDPPTLAEAEEAKGGR